MNRCALRAIRFFIAILFVALSSHSVFATGSVQVTRQPIGLFGVPLPPDPFGLPRPAPNATFIPLTGSFYMHLNVVAGLAGDTVDKSTINITLTRQGRLPTNVVVNGVLQSGYLGEVTDLYGGFFNATYLGTVIYATPTSRLRPKSTYTLTITQANSTNGLTLGGSLTSWSFSTEGSAGTKRVNATLDLNANRVNWTGAFFSGFARDIFSGFDGLDPGSDALYDSAHNQSPKAFGLQRGNYMSYGQLTDPLNPFGNFVPYSVQEMETRRITAFTDGALPGATTLTLSDFFGHGQYGITDNRPTSADYHPGDVILIAGMNTSGQFQYEAATINAVDIYGEIWVHQLSHPASTWAPVSSYHEYSPLNTNLPGNFPTGGCYVYKYQPSGTPVYYWTRLDAALDDITQTHDRRAVINLVDAPGGLSNTGADDTIPKDWDELHLAYHDIASHIIQRYGPATAATFYWSIFNEPDLSPYWNPNWSDVQIFYDYAVDGILRAFDDNGYDSSTHSIQVGGLELGAIFGAAGLTPWVDIFLAHASPTASYSNPAYVANNAACADAYLSGNNLLSSRVKNLCDAHGGKGTPLDFISIHTYNKSSNVASKLITAKQIALGLDPSYYAQLMVNTHESCPDWAPPADPAAWDSYSGDGYFSSWMADVITQLLRQAKADPRYGYGESVMTLWPWPDSNLRGNIQSYTCDVTGPNSTVTTLKGQIFNAITLVASMGDSYLVLPATTTGGHVFGGFATTTAGQAQIMLYDHDWVDYESHSGINFTVRLTMQHVPASTVHVSQYRLDKTYNTYFQNRKSLDAPNGFYVPPSGGSYSAAQINALQSATTLTQTGATRQYATSGGTVTFNVPLSGNGLNYLVVAYP